MKIGYGVDLGGTTVKLGRFDTQGNLCEKWEIPTRREDGGSHIFDDIAQAIRDNAATAGIALEEIYGVGMGIPGDRQKNGFMTVCVNVGLRSLYPAEELSRRLGGIPVDWDNDANVAALGEARCGGGRGYESMLLITLGTGVGGGYIEKGEILRGAHGCGGEIGHIVVRPHEEEFCNCGNRGCLEQVASATGIVREAKRVLNSSSLESVLRKSPSFTAREVMEAAKTGDERALLVVQTMGNYLGGAMATMAQILDPEIFVLGGGVSKAGEFLLGLLYPTYKERTSMISHRAPIVLATLGNDAGIYGAIGLVLPKAT